MAEKLLPCRPGALSNKQIVGLIGERTIRGAEVAKIGDEGLDGSSFDLHLSREYYEMEAAVKPKKNAPYGLLLREEEATKKEVPRGKTVELVKNKVYVFKLKETLAFKEKWEYQRLAGQATGKSTIGRLDVLVRLIAEESTDCYDEVPTGYSGELYVEIIPISFNIIVDEGFPISQLRLFMGRPEYNRISIKEIRELYEDDLIRDEDGRPLQTRDGTHQRLTVNLRKDPNLKGNICAFRAIRTNNDDRGKEAKKLDLAKWRKDKTKIDPHDYWEPIKADAKERILLKKEHFHILRSCERLCLPKDVAVYCQAVTEELGELRVHYAGFAHPYFGRGRPDEKGTPLIFEVRGHNFDTYLRHGEALATLEFYRMSKQIDEETIDKTRKSDYHRQELKLSKCFKEWK